MRKRRSEGHLYESNGRFKAVLIREGVSKNGHRWTRAMLERLAKLSIGVPVQLYDMSQRANRGFMTHWAALRDKLPPAIRAHLPVRLPGANVGKVATAEVVEGDGGVAELVADIDTPEQHTGVLHGLIKQARRIGRTLGLSIHINEGDVEGVPSAKGGLEPQTVHKVTAYDVVSFPSAGGQFLPVLEAWSRGGKSMNLLERLLRLLTKAKREELTEAVDLPPDDVDDVGALIEDHTDFVDGIIEAIGLEVPDDDDHKRFLLEGLSTEPPDQDDPEQNARQKKRAEHMKKKAEAGTAVDRLKSGRDIKVGAKKKKVTTPTPGVKKRKPSLHEDTVTREEFNGLSEDVRTVLAENCLATVESRIKAAKLPKGLEKFAITQWTGVIEDQGPVRLKEVDAFIKDLKSGIGSSQNAGGNLTSNGGRQSAGGPGGHIFEAYSQGDKYLAAFEAMMAGDRYGIVESADGKGEKQKIPAFRGIRHAYGVLTGDVYCEGMPYHMRGDSRGQGVWEALPWDGMEIYQQFRALRGNQGLSEALTTASFPLILSEYMHKQMIREYNLRQFLWKLISRTINVTDFKNWRFLQLGEFANLEVVAEAGNYTDWDSAGPSEEEITFAIQKRGGYAEITWEMIINDELDRIKTFPGKMARASYRTLSAHVFGFLTGNVDYEDGNTNAISSAAHSNTGTNAYSYAEIQAMRKAMHLQTDLDGVETGFARARHVLCGPDLYDQIYSDLFTDGIPYHTVTGEPGFPADGVAADPQRSTTHQNQRAPNILRSKYGLDLHEIMEFGTGETYSDEYWLTADPSEIDMFVVAFLNGKEDPELFVQDLERVGTFFDAEKIRHKIRHIYEAECVDYRGLQARIPT